MYLALVYNITATPLHQVKILLRHQTCLVPSHNDGLDNSINGPNVGNMSQIINSSLSQASYTTFNNASTPAVGIDPINNNIYVVYFKNETGGANLYIQKSTDMGKTFSQPVRVNDVKDSLKVEEQWSAPALSIGPNNDIHVVWYKADDSNPDKYPYGQVTLQYSRSTRWRYDLYACCKSGTKRSKR